MLVLSAILQLCGIVETDAMNWLNFLGRVTLVYCNRVLISRGYMHFSSFPVLSGIAAYLMPSLRRALAHVVLESMMNPIYIYVSVAFTILFILVEMKLCASKCKYMPKKWTCF
jgi:hypothetical protein